MRLYDILEPMEKQRSQYQQLLAEILEYGQKVHTPQGVDALTIIGQSPCILNWLKVFQPSLNAN
jgi:hypothetical protein